MLPEALVAGLEMGRDNQWIINKVELSLFNEKEYVLVYDEGAIFYNIESSDFVDEFKIVVNEWAESKGRTVYYNEEVKPENIPTTRAPSEVLPVILKEAPLDQNLQVHQPLTRDTASEISRQASSNYDLVSEHTPEHPLEGRPPNREQTDTEPGETEDESAAYNDASSRGMGHTMYDTGSTRSVPPPQGQRPQPGRGGGHRRNTGSSGMREIFGTAFKKFRG